MAFQPVLPPPGALNCEDWGFWVYYMAEQSKPVQVWENPKTDVMVRWTTHTRARPFLVGLSLE